MERKEIVFVVVLMIIVFLAGFFVSKINFTGNVVSGEEYGYTKAVCNENKCVDVLVDCKNGNVVSLKPMSEVIDVGNGSLRVNNSELC
jgi:hypothetical protein